MYWCLPVHLPTKEEGTPADSAVIKAEAVAGLAGGPGVTGARVVVEPLSPLAHLLMPPQLQGRAVLGPLTCSCAWSTLIWSVGWTCGARSRKPALGDSGNCRLSQGRDPARFAIGQKLYFGIFNYIPCFLFQEMSLIAKLAQVVFPVT